MEKRSAGSLFVKDIERLDCSNVQFAGMSGRSEGNQDEICEVDVVVDLSVKMLFVIMC